MTWKWTKTLMKQMARLLPKYFNYNKRHKKTIIEQDNTQIWNSEMEAYKARENQRVEEQEAPQIDLS